MSYTTTNFKTKKALKQAIAEGKEVRVYEPGLQIGEHHGEVFLEGPWYPEPHRWYAKAKVESGRIVSVK